MAALRIVVRSSFRLFGTKLCKEVVPHSQKTLGSMQRAPYSQGAYIYKFPHDSVKTSEDKIEYIESNDPEEWKFVERLLPPVVVPSPTTKSEYPSGWKPPCDESTELPYFVHRTKNHMIPVYLHIGHRGIGRRTLIKKIEGDIWLLAQELKAHLEEGLPKGKSIPSQVQELSGWVLFKGDHVTKCQQWLEQKGF